MTETVLITGATAGIGEAISLLFAKNKYRVIITGRRKELLDKLSEKITKEFNAEVYPLCFDIRNKEAVVASLKQLPDTFKTIDILVNNAGLAAGIDSIQEANYDHWDQMIDTNIKGLLYITRAIVPDMVSRKKGHIINISSIAGKDVYPGGSVYCATKSAVDALSKGMRIDMLKHNIRITNISPGAVETEFSLVRFDQDKERAKNIYKGYKPLDAEDVAEAVYFAASRPSHVNIGELTITPAAQANPFFVNKQE
jgi:NADP-dependent 3-hydroxy acid dehydrogenase YdfG